MYVEKSFVILDEKSTEIVYAFEKNFKLDF